MKVRKVTPVLFVDEVEPRVEFWVDRLGFEKTIEVPEGDKLGFVALNNGGIEIMYQTFESRPKDIPALEQDVRKGFRFS